MTINEFNNCYQSLSEDAIKTFLQEHTQENLPASVLGRVFEQLYIDKTTGCTISDIALTDLVALHHSFSLGNGAGWSRTDTSFLGKKYIVVNHKVNNRVTEISTEGYKHNSNVPKSKKISMDTLWELEDAVDIFEGLSAALSDRAAVPDEIYDDVLEKREAATYKMYQIAKAITRNLPIR